MAVKLISSREAAAINGIKIVVYGPAGAGKTRLCATTGQGSRPVIISAEGGMLSLQDYELPVVQVANMLDVREVYKWLGSHEGQGYDWVCFDSISEIAERVLSDAKESAGKDPRKAYGALQDIMYDFIRQFRDLPGRNVYMSAKAGRLKDDATGITTWQPSMPGGKLGDALPYFFDEVLALRLEKDSAGNVIRALQCLPDGQWMAKDRSNRLNQWEQPDLSVIASRILNRETNSVPPDVARAVQHSAADSFDTIDDQPTTSESNTQ